MKRPPTKPYCGLTIVMASPSRFDTTELLSGYAGTYFRECLSPLTIPQCDLRLAADPTPFLKGTKVVLPLGNHALHRHLPEFNFTLSEVRGCPYERDGIIYLASYFPQDAIDMKASYEKDFNKNLTEEEDDEWSGEDNEKATHGKTARSNYKFWLDADVSKAKKLLNDKYRDIMRQQINLPIYEIYPSLDEACRVLQNARGELYLDIETDSCLNLTCVGFSTSESYPKVYVVPIKRYDDTLAYDDLPLFFKALSIAIQRCCVVGHNTAFDLLVLSAGFSVGIGRKNYDTMLSAHRLNIDAEKSLGHCVSLYTYMPYHKSEGVFEPKNDREEQSLWLYNGKDVAVLPMIKKAQLELAELRRAKDSIEQVNDSIYAYLLMTLGGIRLNAEKIASLVAHNDRWMTQILRISKLLIGHDFLPTSSLQCVKYFHTELGLPVVKRNKKTGAPSLDEKALWKLASKHDHPMIPLLLFYRQLKKETGTLLSIPWNLSDDRRVTPGWKAWKDKVTNDKDYDVWYQAQTLNESSQSQAV